MNYGFLNEIYNYISEKYPEFLPDTPAEKAFVQEYITPLLQDKNNKLAYKMEEMFNAARAEAARYYFIFGFKAFLSLLSECMGEDYKNQ